VIGTLLIGVKVRSGGLHVGRGTRAYFRLIYDEQPKIQLTALRALYYIADLAAVATILKQDGVVPKLAAIFEATFGASGGSSGSDVLIASMDHTAGTAADDDEEEPDGLVDELEYRTADSLRRAICMILTRITTHVPSALSICSSAALVRLIATGEFQLDFAGPGGSHGIPAAATSSSLSSSSSSSSGMTTTSTSSALISSNNTEAFPRLLALLHLDTPASKLRAVKCGCAAMRELAVQRARRNEFFHAGGAMYTTRIVAQCYQLLLRDNTQIRLPAARHELLLQLASEALGLLQLLASFEDAHNELVGDGVIPVVLPLLGMCASAFAEPIIQLLHHLASSMSLGRNTSSRCRCAASLALND